MMMMTIQGNLAGSYPQNNVTQIHPRKMMPTSDATNAPPTLPDAGLMIGNEGDSFTPSTTADANISTTPAVADAGDTVTVKHKKKTHKAKKTAKYKKPEKKKGFAGLPWYGKTAVVVGGTIVATPFLALGAAHIWARLPVASKLSMTEIQNLQKKLAENTNMPMNDMVTLLKEAQNKMKLPSLRKPPTEGGFGLLTYAVGTGWSVANTLPRENRVQLVNYASWQLWFDLFKKDGLTDVAKQVVTAFGTPGKKLFQELGNKLGNVSKEELKERFEDVEGPKALKAVALALMSAAIDMQDKAPETPYRIIKGHLVETLEKINAKLPEGQKYDLSSFKNGTPKPIGVASVGQVYDLGDDVVKYFTASPEQLPEYLNMFSALRSNNTAVSPFGTNYKKIKDLLKLSDEELAQQLDLNQLKLALDTLKKLPSKTTEQASAIEFQEEQIKSLIETKLIIDIAKILRTQDTNLSKEKAVLQAIELSSIKSALNDVKVLEQELDVNLETTLSKSMNKDYAARDTEHTFADVKHNGADYDSKRIVVQNKALGIRINDPAFTKLDDDQKLKARAEFVKMQTLYAGVHNDLHGRNMFAVIENGKFVRWSVFDPGRVSIAGDEQTKATNGIQLLMLAEDSSVIDTTPPTSSPSPFINIANSYRNTLFNQASGYTNPNHRFSADDNPLMVVLKNPSAVLQGTAGQQSWIPEDIDRGVKRVWTITCNNKHGLDNDPKNYLAKAYNTEELKVIEEQAESLVNRLIATTGLQLSSTQIETAKRNAKISLLKLIDSAVIEDKSSARYKSLGLPIT